MSTPSSPQRLNTHSPHPRPNRRALVDQVRDLIAGEFILTEVVGPGQFLPSEKELAERYGVSRVTLRAGMRSLQEAGMISSRHGVGWVVITDRSHLMQGLDQLSSLETFAHEAGTVVTTEHLSFEELEADSKLAETLGVSLGHRVLATRRVKLLDGAAVAWLLDFVPDGVLPFGTLRKEFAGSVLDVLLAHPEVDVQYADCEIQPVNLSVEIAVLLGVQAGLAALFTESIVRNANDGVVEWAQGWLLPEHLRFRVRRRRQIGH